MLRPPVVTARLAVLALVPAIAACGSAAGHDTTTARAAAPTVELAAAPPAPAPAGAACRAAIDGELRAIATRIYRQAAAGRAVAAVRRRLGHAPALGAAVARGDPAATRAALHPLLKNQIRRIVIRRGPRVLVDQGRAPALAPVTGVVHDAGGRPVGRYVLSVAADAPVAGITRTVTGARVAIGPVVQAPVTIRATAWPSGPLTIGLWPAAPHGAVCRTSAAATRAAVIGQVGRRLFDSEAAGPATRRVLRHVARDRGFRAAVAAHDPVALRAAIVRFFRQRTLHVVRIRATDAAGHLIGDVGGLYVLAPASAPVADAAGRTIGRVTLAIQDDTGYLKLVHRFTGAGVALRTAAGPVPGGTVHAHGPATRLRYAVRAFPTGALSVTLSVPQRSAATR